MFIVGFGLILSLSILALSSCRSLSPCFSFHLCFAFFLTLLSACLLSSLFLSLTGVGFSLIFVFHSLNETEHGNPKSIR